MPYAAGRSAATAGAARTRSTTAQSTRISDEPKPRLCGTCKAAVWRFDALNREAHAGAGLLGRERQSGGAAAAPASSPVGLRGRRSCDLPASGKPALDVVDEPFVEVEQAAEEVDHEQQVC